MTHQIKLYGQQLFWCVCVIANPDGGAVFAGLGHLTWNYFSFKWVGLCVLCGYVFHLSEVAGACD